MIQRNTVQKLHGHPVRGCILPLAVCAALLTLLSPSAFSEEFDWGMLKVDAMDYIPFSKVAEFYALDGEVTSDNAFVSLENKNSYPALDASIDSRQIIINGVKHWLGYPVIEMNGEAMVSRIDLAKTIEPSLRPEKIAATGDIKTVILDAGHGGKDRGAVNGKVNEKDLNLDVCMIAKEMLESKGFNVVMTRDSDTLIPLEVRARMANQHEDAIFVSVHFNYSPNGSDANGFEVFAMSPTGTPSTDDTSLRNSHMKIYPGNGWDAENLVLANCVQHAVLGSMPQFDRGVKRARFAVLKLTRMPAILVEGAFLSNGEDTEKASCTNWRSSLAYAITAGAVEFRRLALENTAPKILAEYRTPAEVGLASVPSIEISTQ